MSQQASNVPGTFTPTRLYLASGSGVAKENKNARDHAGDEMGISDLNVVTVTSILPAGIRLIERDEFRSSVVGGQVVFAIDALCESNVPFQTVNSTLTVALPEDPDVVGYVAELFEFPGITDQGARQRVEKMVLGLFANHQGADEQEAAGQWQDGKTDYTIAGKAIRLHTMQAAAVVPENGDYACALVAAVLLP
jgi:arginine decarboxylase